MPLPAFPYELLPARAAVRARLDRYGLRAKKAWGQNFLVDEHAHQAVVAAAELHPADLVVEIGAGLGTLTERLLRTGAQVVAVERERDMCTVLRAELGHEPRLRLCEQDALQLDVARLAEEHGSPVVVVGNLPYCIASPLLFHLLAARDAIHHLVLMLQREVADRLLARPGDNAFSALSAQVQILCEVRRVCQVGAGSFVPVPRVDSTLVRLDPLPSPRVPVKDLRRYAEVVRAAFGQRRKTLRNALGAVFGPAAAAALDRAGIDPSRRGETLTLEEFARLADQLPPPAETGRA
ncbi:MAG: 16S rRNA (adenine(1518)-N(6)/adenine(1519)-N(6))-dimethyltransferase RsmA [Myxococcales bacterium]|nr:16S rRNA (adenine(1518)-N(6)/adenine(1519)-N(6))-dimethyltransferase RsmA [Myxococcota bacterium]MDW8280650.1 16S rRNA (adenine(1518)-N(6)/adenine(1519)-N(6))-dimethyltransferase RsmA [Myxococcales bacterium]